MPPKRQPVRQPTQRRSVVTNAPRMSVAQAIARDTMMKPDANRFSQVMNSFGRNPDIKKIPDEPPANPEKFAQIRSMF